MSETLGSAELDGQHMEILPPRTVMSLFSTVGEPGTPGAGGHGEPGSGHNESNLGTGTQLDMESLGIPGPDGSAKPGL